MATEDYPKFICSHCATKYANESTLTRCVKWVYAVCGWCKRLDHCSDPAFYDNPPHQLWLPHVD